jgi:hypothetical protein
MVAEHGDDLFRLAQPQKAVIDEDAGELVADGFVDQDGGDRAVDPAGQAADDLGVADLVADLADGFLAVGAHRPVALEPGQADEVFVELRALGGVVDLGVELHGVEPAGGSAVMAKGALGEVP